VKYLAQNPRVDVNQADNLGRTPFHIACEKGCLKIVKHLAQDARMDFNQPKNNGGTPLEIAHQNNHIQIVEFITNTRECIKGNRAD